MTTLTEDQKNTKLVPAIDIARDFAEETVGLTPRRPAEPASAQVPAAVTARAKLVGGADSAELSENFENRGVKLS